MVKEKQKEYKYVPQGVPDLPYLKIPNYSYFDMTRIKDMKGLRAYMVKVAGEDNVYIAENMGQVEEEAYRINEDHNPGEMVDRIVFLGFVENDDRLKWSGKK